MHMKITAYISLASLINMVRVTLGIIKKGSCKIIRLFEPCLFRLLK